MSTSKKSHFALIFRQACDTPDPSPEEMQQIFGRWTDWMKGMKAKGQFVDASHLMDEGKVLRGTAGATLTDGPFAEAKEVMGGLAVVAAATLAEAAEIARGCPGLGLGTVVEVRPVYDHPPI